VLEEIILLTTLKLEVALPLFPFNNVGGADSRNRAVQDLFEPGSIFKPITMSIAIDAETVNANTTFNDSGPVFVDDFRINNAVNKNYGVITMTQALETSNNVAMAWLSRQIGRNLFHNYMIQFKIKTIVLLLKFKLLFYACL
jgi:cell division protein FtsI/penicillin-binding protein 2